MIQTMKKEETKQDIKNEDKEIIERVINRIL